MFFSNFFNRIYNFEKPFEIDTQTLYFEFLFLVHPKMSIKDYFKPIETDIIAVGAASVGLTTAEENKTNKSSVKRRYKKKKEVRTVCYYSFKLIAYIRFK